MAYYYPFRDWMKEFDAMRPSRLLNQHFGMGLNADELLRSALLEHQSVIPRYYNRPWRMSNQDIGSTVEYNKDQYQISLDVQQFSPDEIQVKIVDDTIVVEGKHEEKQDEHGYISRHFVRRYVVPKQYKLDVVAPSLSSDGVLTISLPCSESQPSNERIIPITCTGTLASIKTNDK